MAISLLQSAGSKGTSDRRASCARIAAHGSQSLFAQWHRVSGELVVSYARAAFPEHPAFSGASGPGTQMFLDESVITMHELHPMAKFRAQSANSDPVSSFRGRSRPAEARGDVACRETGILRRSGYLGGRRSAGRRRRRSAGRSAGRWRSPCEALDALVAVSVSVGPSFTRRENARISRQFQFKPFGTLPNLCLPENKRGEAESYTKVHFSEFLRIR